MNKESIELSFFSHGSKDFFAMLDENNIPNEPLQKFPPGTILASGGVVEIITAIGGASLIPSIAAVLVQWLKNKASRKVQFLTEDNKPIIIEGYDIAEVEKIIMRSKRITIIQTDSDD